MGNISPASGGDGAARIIVALDVETQEKACSLVRELAPPLRYFKVGFRLFVACGPSVIAALQGLGAKIFLDLKFHDIPNTVAEAAAAAARLGVAMFNVHLSGGREMIRAAVDAAAAAAEQLGRSRPHVLGVTVLSSFHEAALAETGVARTIDDQVVALARLGLDCGLDGVIASPREAMLLRQHLGGDFLIVTPGVRPAGAAADDQQRILTPRQALQAGASYLVIGRPIIKDAVPRQAMQNILEELNTEQ
ncbi:MAG TPA: orotidine-5'-phosphate decarboxylase [Firmicutes bacterium]|nr:orotidine-5'-phosphate decarboxylase [Bacillota bacterium]